MLKIESDSDNTVLQMGLVTVRYALSLGAAGLFLWFLSLFWSDYILFDIKDLMGSVSGEGLSRVWFIFAWGLVATVLLGLLGRSADRRLTTSRTKGLAVGTWVSVNAGFFEELEYRWIRFFTAMIVLPFVNFITFGLVKWLYGNIFVPVANFFTFHALDAQLHDPRSWVVGAAIVAASVKFRDAHEHLGALGVVNAWFIGMVFFWLMFGFGLWTAIVAHIVYDIIVFGTAVLMAKSQNSRFSF